MLKLNLKLSLLTFLMNNGIKSRCEINFIKAFKVLQKNIFKNHKIIFKLCMINSTLIISFKKTGQKRKAFSKVFPFLINKKNRLFFSLKLIFVNLKKNLELNKKFQLFFFLNKQISLIAKRKNLKLIRIKNILQNKSLLKKKYLNFRWFF